MKTLSECSSSIYERVKNMFVNILVRYGKIIKEIYFYYSFIIAILA